MKKFLLLIILLIINTRTLAKEQISNMITPVSYFVNHEQQLKTLDKHLTKYQQASIVGISGIGKTQLIRMYVYENKNNYDLIWFFDCNLDINEQFVKLAKQLNSIKQTNISEKVALAKKEVISYLTSTNKWLLVFDNLKVNENNKVQDFINWKHNGHVVFCSQDNEKLPNIIAMPILDRSTIIALANNLLNDKDKIEFLIQSFSGYPILIVQGTQLLNKIKGLNKEEYKKKIYQSSDKIATNINMAIQQLKPSTVNLLNKIALLNNQSFSKQLLTIITDNKDTLNDDIYQLSKFMLISNIDSDENNPVFEMHDVVSNKIMEMNGTNNKIWLENIISNLPKMKGAHSAYVWKTTKTISENLEILLKNSEKYNINLYAILTLRAELFSIYMNTRNNKAQQMFDWFNQKDKNKELKLWQMSESQKFFYARYLGLIGGYHEGILKNFETAISYHIKSLEILDKLVDDEANYSFKLNVLCHISANYINLSEIKLAEEFLKKAEELLTLGAIKEDDMSIIDHLKSGLCKIQGKYQESLEYEDKIIELRIKNGMHNNDLAISYNYLYRTNILNSLGRYQEAYTQAQQIYDVHKSLNKNNGIFAYIYREMARSELGLGKIDKASEYINQAIFIWAMEENITSEGTSYSKNHNLAFGYTVQGDVLLAQNNVKQAIDSYKQAFTIYHYLYKEKSKNMVQVSDLYNHAAKAACKNRDLYNYKFFGKPQIKEFGIHHPNTVDMLEYCKQHNMDLWTKNN